MSEIAPGAVRILPVNQWPPADAAAWHRACGPQSSLLAEPRQRSPATYRKYAAGWGAFLWFLTRRNWLDPAETPAERVTLERLDGYFRWLRQCGCSDYTIVGRFEELRGTLGLIYPERDFTFVTQPNGLSIRRRLRMSRKDRYIPDFREVVLWAVALFEKALTLADPARRQVLVRDAAIIGIVASRAPRLRALTGMCLGRHLLRSGDGWMLSFDEFLMKGEAALELPSDPRINAILDRYVAVERRDS